VKNGESRFGQLLPHYNAVLRNQGRPIEVSSDAEMTGSLRAGKAPTIEALQARGVTFEKLASVGTFDVVWEGLSINNLCVAFQRLQGLILISCVKNGDIRTTSYM
jgi:hypothetical protein